MKNIKVDGIEVAPSKIVCVGRNYAAHIEELGNEVPPEPVIFIKPNSAISKEIYTCETDTIHYESEITFVVKNGALSAVGFGLDLTKRDIQSNLKAKGLPWERAKAFDGSAVFSEFLSLQGPINDLELILMINGKITQQSGYQLMLHKPEQLLDEISRFLTMEDGDLFMTGTPAGVGEINRGDEFHATILDSGSAIIEQSWVVKP